MKSNILVIGAGPAALYATQKLAKQGHHCVVVNRDLKHGGLAEFGIYPNKYKMKSGLRTMFDKILSDANVSYFGNVTVGANGSVSLEELEALGFDAVVVAVGAQGTKWLGLPGEELAGVYHAKDIVYHYNGLPPFSETDYPIGERVVVVGLGNVCLDIVHWLVCEKKTPFVTAVARRGPAERKYTEKEMKLVSGALDRDAVRDDFERNRATMTAVSQDVDALFSEVTAHVDVPLETESSSSFNIRFFRSPSALVGENGKVQGVVCDVTQLVPREDGSLSARATGETETIPCDTVVFAIGDSIEDAIGLPLSEDGKTFATVPTPWKEDTPRYMVYDPATASPKSGYFVVGWARRASDGLVGKARKDATTGCDEVLAYLDGEFGPVDLSGKTSDDIDNAVRNLLEQRAVQFVTYEDVCKLVDAERAKAEELGLPEFKYQTTNQMFEQIQGADS